MGNFRKCQGSNRRPSMFGVDDKNGATIGECVFCGTWRAVKRDGRVYEHIYSGLGYRQVERGTERSSQVAETGEVR